MDYEKEQSRLKKLVNDFLSDDDQDRLDDKDDVLDDVYSSDEYQLPSDDSDSTDASEPKTKKRRKRRKTKGIPHSQGVVDNHDTDSEDSAVPGPSSETSFGGAGRQDHSVSETIEEVIAKYLIGSDEEDSDNEVPIDVDWGPVDESVLNSFPFTEGQPGIKPSIYDNFHDKEPYDVFKLFITGDIIQHMVTETNRYAHQTIQKGHKPKSRLKHWVDTNSEEMELFLGILLWMGLCKLPSIPKYWSKCPLYQNKIKKKMSRNRFELLLRTWHFSNNEEASVSLSDRLHKLTPLLTQLNERYQYVLTPGEDICIDETVVPFKGRLSFRQYIKGKRYKFGIKLFKLCTNGGYTYVFSVYCGKEKELSTGISVPTKVVLQLSEKLLDKGRTLYTDNYYTSVTLAHELLKHNTHLVGTLRSNRKHNCKEVVQGKLEAGDVIARQSNTGVVMLKWKDKKDVLMLSTKHNASLETIRQKGKEVTKPKMIIEYNKGKCFVDVSDQKKSYSAPLRRGIKWYRKLAVELILGATIINAHYIYREVVQKKISVTEFREEVATKLLRCSENEEEVDKVDHVLQERSSKLRCVVCYENIKKEHGRKVAQNKTPRTKWECVGCEQRFCIGCFFLKHICSKK